MKERNSKQVNPVQVTLAPEWYSRMNSGSCRPRTVFSLRAGRRGQACRRAYSHRAAGPAPAAPALHGFTGSSGRAGPRGTAGIAGTGIPLQGIDDAGDAG